MKTRILLAAQMAVVIAAAASPGRLFAQVEATLETRQPDVIFVPTPQAVVDTMLKMADVKSGEMVYDLGCGDGRIVITAARDFGARGIGVDIDPKRISESRENATKAGVTDRVQFRQTDLFTMNFADADVVMLYLLPALNVRLRPRILDELKPGTRVVSHAFMMGEWEPDEKAEVGNPAKSVYFWRVPAKVEGDWTVRLPGGETGTLSLQQEFQKVSGTLKRGNQKIPLSEGRLSGSTLSFSYGSGGAAKGTAQFSGNRFTGTMTGGGSRNAEEWSGERSL